MQTWVDLGLSVKWSSCNLGADSPEEYGDYYGWGEIETYYENLDPLTWKQGKESGYDWDSYKWCNGSLSTLTKYNYDESYGVVDDKMSLEDSDDVASINLGGAAHIPTVEEWNELHDNSIWELVTQNGVNGIKITSTKPGYEDKSIFLPGAGYMYKTLLSENNGETGFYWTSSINETYPYAAWFVLFSGDNSYTNESQYYYMSYFDRKYGFSIRPVL